MSSKPQEFGLFWLTDNEDAENWFIVSPLPEATNLDESMEAEDIAEFLAKEFHARYEGFSSDIVFDLDIMYHEQVGAQLITTLTLDDLSIDMAQASAEWVETAKEELSYWEHELGSIATRLMKPETIRSMGGIKGLFSFLLCGQLQANDGVSNIFKTRTTQDQVNDLYACFHRVMCQRHAVRMGYAPFHAQVDLLESLGFAIIDDGVQSLVRTVVYDGELFTEGDMDAKLSHTRNRKKK